MMNRDGCAAEAWQGTACGGAGCACGRGRCRDEQRVARDAGADRGKMARAGRQSDHILHALQKKALRAAGRAWSCRRCWMCAGAHHEVITFYITSNSSPGKYVIAVCTARHVI